MGELKRFYAFSASNCTPAIYSKDLVEVMHLPQKTRKRSFSRTISAIYDIESCEIEYCGRPGKVSKNSIILCFLKSCYFHALFRTSLAILGALLAPGISLYNKSQITHRKTPIIRAYPPPLRRQYTFDVNSSDFYWHDTCQNCTQCRCISCSSLDKYLSRY